MMAPRQALIFITRIEAIYKPTKSKYEANNQMV